MEYEAIHRDEPPMSHIPAYAKLHRQEAPPAPSSSISEDSSLLMQPRIVVTSSGKRIVYPANTVRNPAASRPADRLDPTLGELERPEFIPADLDSRVDRSNVWMKTAPGSGNVYFFIPGACDRCAAGAAHCDREEPTCGRCKRAQSTCVPGSMRQLVPGDAPGAAVVNGEGRLPNEEEKGKAKATEGGEDHSDVSDGELVEGSEGVSGRSKRVRKKRRLSASDEIDPNLLNFDGSALKKPRGRPPRSSMALPNVTSIPTKPADVRPNDDDIRYRTAEEANSNRPPLNNMRGFCPVWADRRRALFAASEYLRAPICTAGASVDIGSSGVARGVILEGAPPIAGTFWGEGSQAGTIVTSIGKPRPKAASAEVIKEVPLPNIADEFNQAWTHGADVPKTELTQNGSTPTSVGEKPISTPENGASNGITSIPNGAETSVLAATGDAPTSTTTEPTESSKTRTEPTETAPVEALLMAQRARTPVAVAVAHDYEGVPFKVPRAVIVLGWFWITEAWTEPVPDSEQVGWKFRFEWCTGAQRLPWWTNKKEAERTPTPTIEDESGAAWPVRGPGVVGPTTLRGAQTPREGTDPAELFQCSACGLYSDRIYASTGLCLNERCTDYFVSVEGDHGERGPTSLLPAAVREEQRILPEQLRLSLTPKDPRASHAEIRREDAQRDFWRAWVCRRCRLANERRDWFGYLCEACSFLDAPARKVFDAAALRAPSRVVCTGPRPDEGMAQWPIPVVSSATIFPDNVKVVKHVPSSASFEVSHALATEGNDANLIANTALNGLQIQGPDEVRFRRHALPAFSCRPAELSLSPFYTYICGPDPVPYLSNFPTGAHVPWDAGPQVCLDMMDLINERAGRMYPGQPEFNSLLMAAMPPLLPATVHPTIPVAPDSYVAFLFLGSEANVRFRRTGVGRTRGGEILAQHGDVVVVRTGSDSMEVEVKPDGFGFVGIARTVYHRLDKEGSPTKNGPPYLPTQSAPFPAWYVGPRPLSPSDPLRPQPPQREWPLVELGDRESTPPADQDRIFVEQSYTGQEVTPLPPASPTLLAPPELPPLPKLGDGADAKPVKGTKRGRASDVADTSIAPSPRGGRPARGRGSRGGAMATPRGRGRGRGRAVASSDGVASSGASPAPAQSSPAPRGAPGGRGSRGGRGGRGRKSGASIGSMTPSVAQSVEPEPANDAAAGAADDGADSPNGGGPSPASPTAHGAGVGNGNHGFSATASGAQMDVDKGENE